MSDLMPVVGVWAMGGGTWAVATDRWETAVVLALGALLAFGQSSILDRLEARP